MKDTPIKDSTQGNTPDNTCANKKLKLLAPNRRTFINCSLQAGAAALLMDSAIEHLACSEEAVPLMSQAQRSKTAPVKKEPLINFPNLPARVFIHQENGMLVPTSRTGTRFTSQTTEIQFDEKMDGMSIRVTCPNGPLSRVIIRWERHFPQDTLYLGDAWERSYGNLQWRFLEPERIMPWYFAAHQEATGRTLMLGVKTQPSTLCFWMVDGEGISLWLDFRNGGSPSIPGQREILAATVTSLEGREDESPLSALRRFCQLMCPNPRLPTAPVCGSNNWYYAYGKNVSATASRLDAAFLAEIAEGETNRPYCVIDGGWTPIVAGPGGEWTQGNPKTFPDMPGLAADMKRLGVRPGIWIRPSAITYVADPGILRAGPVAVAEKPLDLTLPENLVSVHDDIARMKLWGYELIKHDFSTYDLFGRWGFEMGAEITDPGWHFHDQSLTNAEIILQYYRTLREAAGDAVLLGCNTMGHLGAGYFEVQRIGDDVSGHIWERTRRMGVNTLAYRFAQNGTFFRCDPDCAAHTEKTPWELDRQFLDLVAHSGGALFVSIDPQKATSDQTASYQRAMKVALAGGAMAQCEPLDWLYNTSPEQWMVNNRLVNYQWSESMGTSPFRV